MRPSVVIYAKDMATIARFYTSVLGLTEKSRADDHILLHAPTYSIAIVGIRPRLAAQIEISTPPKLREDVAIKLVLPVDSLSRVRAIAADFGGAIGPIERQWSFDGLIRCDGNDPEGNIIQFAEGASHPPT